MMNSLNEPAGTPFLFLLAAGGIMVLTLVFSKKAHNVVKTSIGLSRQSEGDEMFGTSSVARSMVRSTTAVAETVSRYVPALPAGSTAVSARKTSSSKTAPRSTLCEHRSTSSLPAC